jgi:predicted methyltransferase
VILDLQGLQLRLYEVEDNRPVFDKSIDQAIVTLKQGDWRTLLSLREDDKRIVIMQAGSDDLISGLSVLGSTPESAFFINLVGHLTSKSMAKIAESLDSSL